MLETSGSWSEANLKRALFAISSIARLSYLPCFHKTDSLSFRRSRGQHPTIIFNLISILLGVRLILIRIILYIIRTTFFSVQSFLVFSRWLSLLSGTFSIILPSPGSEGGEFSLFSPGSSNDLLSGIRQNLSR